jgi:hypothetical protein
VEGLLTLPGHSSLTYCGGDMTLAGESRFGEPWWTDETTATHEFDSGRLLADTCSPSPRGRVAITGSAAGNADLLLPVDTTPESSIHVVGDWENGTGFDRGSYSFEPLDGLLGIYTYCLDRTIGAEARFDYGTPPQPPDPQTTGWAGVNHIVGGSEGGFGHEHCGSGRTTVLEAGARFSTFFDFSTADRQLAGALVVEHAIGRMTCATPPSGGVLLDVAGAEVGYAISEVFGFMECDSLPRLPWPTVVVLDVEGPTADTIFGEGSFDLSELTLQVREGTPPPVGARLVVFQLPEDPEAYSSFFGDLPPVQSPGSTCTYEPQVDELTIELVVTGCATP